jgi:4-amino-4-deoxy-L-arabinose transferase-like glycosyltransferase
VLAAGVGLRVWAYWTRGAFWIDEAALASNIVDRPWSAVARPFIYQQLAPYFYVLLTKLLTVLLGVSEWSLRLPSLLAGLGLLPLLALLARRLFALPAAVCAVAFASFAPLLVHYSGELKPYAGDAFVATALLLMLWHAFEEGRSGSALLPLTAAGMLAPWFSLPSIFVLAAAGAAWVVDGITGRRERRYWLAVAAAGSLWLLSFAAHYALVLRMRPEDANSLQLYWIGHDGFPLSPVHAWTELRWFVAKGLYVFTLFVAPGRFGVRYFMALCWLCGLVIVWRRNKAMAVALVVPLLIFFAATASRAYVMTDRLLLFAAPSIIVPCAGGIAALAGVRSVVSPLAAAWLVAGTALLNAARLPAALTWLHPPAASGTRAALVYLQKRFQPADVLYVDELSYWVSAYYAKRVHLDVPCMPGESTDHVLARISNPLQALAGYRRVWALVPVENPRGAGVRTPVGPHEHLLKERLSAIGTQVSVIEAGDVRVYLYEVSAGLAGTAARAALPPL